MNKICFKDLSGWLKTAVVIAWIELGLYGLYFVIAFIQEVIKV